MPVNYGDRPFREQIAFFRRKLNLPTESWTQLFQEGHDHAFVVAGANRDALVADFRQAIDKAIADGTTLDAFRNDFDTIVHRHGWRYHGGRGWRSRVIYDTNLRTSYAAGRYQQLQQIKQTRPYWEYHHTPVQNPRALHVHWDGLILPADDQWWQTHYPPNGWGCQCVVYSRSQRDLERMGKSGPDEAPPVEWETRTIGKTGPAPRTVTVPNGVSPGFAYTPGATAWGEGMAANALALGEAIERGGWTRLVTTNWEDYGRPRDVPLVDAPELSERVGDTAAVAGELTRLMGANQRFYRPGGVPVTVIADTLARHIDPNRAAYLPLLLDTLADPYEVWASLEKRGGYYALRVRAIKAYRLPGRGQSALVVADGGEGFMQGWTFVPVRQRNYLRHQRMGVLIYGE